MSTTLSEADSRRLLAAAGVPFAPQELVDDAAAAVVAASGFGRPVAAKLCGDNIAHKTERGLVRLGLLGDDAVRLAAEELFAAGLPDDGVTGVLVAPMVSGTRELIAGMSVDPQFGPTVMVGVGGVLAEAVADVSIRLVPVSDLDAHEMLDDLRLQDLLGEFRGEPPVDRDAVAGILTALSELAAQDPSIRSVDLNPIIISDGQPIAVDALVERA